MGPITYKPSVVTLMLSTAAIGQQLAPLTPACHRGCFKGEGQRKANKANRWR